MPTSPLSVDLLAQIRRRAKRKKSKVKKRKAKRALTVNPGRSPALPPRPLGRAETMATQPTSPPPLPPRMMEARTLLRAWSDPTLRGRVSFSIEIGCGRDLIAAHAIDGAKRQQKNRARDAAASGRSDDHLSRGTSTSDPFVRCVLRRAAPIGAASSATRRSADAASRPPDDELAEARRAALRAASHGSLVERLSGSNASSLSSLSNGRSSSGTAGLRSASGGKGRCSGDPSMVRRTACVEASTAPLWRGAARSALHSGGESAAATGNVLQYSDALAASDVFDLFVIDARSTASKRDLFHRESADLMSAKAAASSESRGLGGDGGSSDGGVSLAEASARLQREQAAARSGRGQRVEAPLGRCIVAATDFFEAAALATAPGGYAGAAAALGEVRLALRGEAQHAAERAAERAARIGAQRGGAASAAAGALQARATPGPLRSQTIVYDCDIVSESFSQFDSLPRTSLTSQHRQRVTRPPTRRRSRCALVLRRRQRPRRSTLSTMRRRERRGGAPQSGAVSGSCTRSTRRAPPRCSRRAKRGELFLCTVTFCANPANDLTCHPSYICITVQTPATTLSDCARCARGAPRRLVRRTDWTLRAVHLRCAWCCRSLRSCCVQ